MKKLIIIAVTALITSPAFASDNLVKMFTSGIPDDDLQTGLFCFEDSRDARELIKGEYRAKPDFSGNQPRWYDGSGLSWYTRKGSGYTVTYLSRSDIARAADVLDDEFDLNFDQYRPRDYQAAGIGNTFTIYPCLATSRAAYASFMKEQIADAYYTSEGDYQWFPVYSKTRVSRSWSEASVRRAIGTDRPVNVYSEERSARFLQWAIEGEDDAAQYADLLSVLNEFEDYRVVKVGEEDSGALDLYIFVRLNSGHVIGLKTITIET